MMKHVPLLIVLIASAAVGTLLILHSQLSDVSLRSVQEIGAEIFEGADRFGHRLVRISDAKEMEIGRQLADQLVKSSALLSTGETAVYVERVGRTLLSGINRKRIQYQFYVLDASWPNAFALPGGHIYITTALLQSMESEAQLAFVLGHEIGHVDLRHAADLLEYEYAAGKLGGDILAAATALGYTVYRQGYTKQKEFAADAAGFYLSVAQNYHPGEGIRLLKTFAGEKEEGTAVKPRGPQEELVQVIGGAIRDYFHSHPPFYQRSERFQRMIREMKLPGRTFYAGCRNFRQRISREQEDFPQEWLVLQMEGSSYE